MLAHLLHLQQVAASLGPEVEIRTGARGGAVVVVPAARLVVTGVPGDSGSLRLQVEWRQQQDQHAGKQGRGGGAAATRGAEEWCTTEQLQLEAFVSVPEVRRIVEGEHHTVPYCGGTGL